MVIVDNVDPYTKKISQIIRAKDNYYLYFALLYIMGYNLP